CDQSSRFLFVARVDGVEVHDEGSLTSGTRTRPLRNQRSATPPKLRVRLFRTGTAMAVLHGCAFGDVVPRPLRIVKKHHTMWSELVECAQKPAVPSPAIEQDHVKQLATHSVDIIVQLQGIFFRDCSRQTERPCRRTMQAANTPPLLE